MTKKHYYIYKAWKNSTIDDIYKAYKNPSVYKRNAFSDIWFLMKNLHGKNLKIIGHNSMVFSCAFEYPDENTGEICLAYFTRNNRDFFPLTMETAKNQVW